MKRNEITLNVGDITLRGQSLGNPQGEPLLMLHGWLDNSASFNPIAPFLAQYHIVAIDLPGHGHSDHLALDNPYHFIDSVTYVQRIVQALQWERFRLLGHSMGGGIATLYAGVAPETVSHLAIIEGLGPLTETAESVVTQVRDYLRKSARILSRPRHVYHTVDDAAKARAKKGFISYQEAYQLAKRGTVPTVKGVVWRHDPKLYLPSPIRLTEQQVLAFINEITAPVCFIVASDGFRYDESKMQLRRAAVKSLQEVHVNGGHHVHMEDPEAVADVLNAFYAKPDA